MALCKTRDVSELYALADKCARAEEGRKIPGEVAGAEGSDSEDTAPTSLANRRRNNRKRKAKDVLAVEHSGNGGGSDKAKADDSSEAVVAADKQDGSGKRYCKIHHTKGHDLQTCKKVEQMAELQKAEYERRDKERAQGGGGGSGKKLPARGGHRGKASPRPRQGR